MIATAPEQPRLSTRDRRGPEGIVSEVVDAVRHRLMDSTPCWGTYRLQFAGGQFRFTDASSIAEYLGDLGISHVYTSPLLKARRGSTHGYDAVDHGRLHDELGSAAEFDQMTEALARRGVGLIVDVVPNHMSVAGDENEWWMDVLAHGAASRYAPAFDIDWHPMQTELHDKVLLPVLDDFYGNVLEAGRLPLIYDEGAFLVQCHDMRLPLDPRTCGAIIEPGLPELTAEMGPEHPDLLELQSILTAWRHLSPRTATSRAVSLERHRESLVVRRRLASLYAASPRIARHVQDNLRRINGDPVDPRSFDELDRLLEAQAYRLVHWRAGSDEMNYRRFFDVTELAAVSMEHTDVFQSAHRLLFELMERGQVQGLRIDHVDGLLDPAQYLWRLQWQWLRVLGRQEHARLAGGEDPMEVDARWLGLESAVLAELADAVGGPDPRALFDELAAAPSSPSRQGRSKTPVAAATRSDTPRRQPLFVVVEKILGSDEPLPPDWPVAGTTGYDTLNLINGLFIDPQGLPELERYYARFIDRRDNVWETAYQCKRLVLDGAMHSELQLLAHRLNRLSCRHRRTRDLTLQSLRAALREIIASFPVYRTYLSGRSISERDRRVVLAAVAQAGRRNPAIEASAMEFVRGVLLGEQPAGLDAEGEAERAAFVGRFQQVTSPVMAKGVEDTAFYRYLPLVSANEVGGQPGHPVVPVTEFHRQNAARARDWPCSFVASTTHDTKRSEDVRARIDVLSEAPALWRSAVQRWTRWNRKHRREVDGLPAPSRNDEWLFYQTLAGVWPVAAPDDVELATLVTRLQGYMEKASREAKLRTSWVRPNLEYEAAVRDFIARVLADRDGRFARDVQLLLDQIVESGLYSSLSQVLLKLLSPGVGDIYQGQELWDFSLVDPDNRRPVDYDRRRWLLGELKSATATSERRREVAHHLARNPQDDRLKLLVTWTALQLRKEWPRLCEEADYLAIEATGPQAEHVCAFAWRPREGSEQERSILVVVPRLLFTLLRNSGSHVPCDMAVWTDTQLVTGMLPGGEWTEQITGRTVECGTTLPMAECLAEFPVALLASNKPESCNDSRLVLDGTERQGTQP
jgi:(1->4)-alpha-D-glucan 1-alpha-D-glucosylmutase